MIRALLNHPAVIIGTLWPERYAAYTTVPAPGGSVDRTGGTSVLDLADVVRIAPAFSEASRTGPAPPQPGTRGYGSRWRRPGTG